MADSLIVAGSIELLGMGTSGANGVVSSLPLCKGAVFTVDPGLDMGSPQPVVDLVESLILNGERPYGTRASNRTISLPISIIAPTRTLLAGAIETLLALIDQQTWTLQWTRDPGSGTALPLILDCFRANPSKPVYNLIDAVQMQASITIEFQALPYGRSGTSQQLTFASPIGGTSAPPSPVTLDSFSSVASIAQWSQSSQHVVGSYSAEWNPGAAPADNPDGAGMVADYVQAISGANITGLPNIGFWAGFGSSYYYFIGYFSPFTFNITLTDNLGRTISFGVTQSCTVSSSNGSPAWTYVTAPIPQGAAFNYADVTGYEIVITNNTYFFGGGGGGPGGVTQLTFVVAYLNDLQAIAVSAGSAASIRGTIYTLQGITGTAPAPLSLQFAQSGGTAFQTLIAHRPGPDAPASLSPFVSVGNGGDTPNGSTFYTIPSLVTGINATFDGTYSIMLTAETWSSPSTSRQVTVTVYQYEQSGGTSATATVSRTFTPSTDVTNGMVVLGELTLPVSDIAPDNVDAYFAITVTDTNTADRFLDCIFLDTMGQTCWVNLATSNYTIFYIDAPTTDRDLGRVLGSTSGRAQATSVLASSFVSGGPLTVDPGSCTLFCYSIQGAPSLVAYFFPNWFVDRLS